MKTKIYPSVYLSETDSGYTVESNYRNGFTRKRNAVSIKKTGDIKKDLLNLEEAKRSAISHYETMEYKSAVGIIVQDVEYTICGIRCSR